MATQVAAWTTQAEAVTQLDVVLNSGPGANAQEGDILLMSWGWANGTSTTGPTITFASGSHTAPTNLVATSAPASGSVTSGVYAWRVPASKPSYIRFTASPTDDGFVNTVILRGVPSVSDLRASTSGWAGASAVNSTPPSITDTLAGALVYAGVDIASGSENVSVSGTGWSPLLASTERRGYMAVRTPSAGGTIAGPQFSWPTAGAYRPRSWMVVVDVAAVPAPTLTRTLVGIRSTTGFGASCQTTNTTQARLKVGTNSSVTTGVVTSSWATPDDAGYAQASVTGLTAGTSYWYQWELEDAAADVHSSTIYGPVRLANPADFTFAFGSCYNPGYHGDGGRYPSFDKILARNPNLFFHLGDWDYADQTSTSQAAHRADMENSFNVSGSLRDLCAVTPFVYKQGDHDAGGNTEFPGVWTSPNRAAARQVFPYPTLPDTLALYHSFVIGRVRFIVTDDYTYANTDGSTKLGATQRAWFLNELEQPEPVKVWLSATIWNKHDDWVPGDGADDAWGFFPTERALLVTHMQTAMVGTLVVLSGDAHGLFADDGTNTWDGSPTFSAAPFLQYGSSKTVNDTADWTQGGSYNGAELHSRYGWGHVTDDGETIKIAMTGHNESDTAVVSLEVEVVTAASEGTATGSTAWAGAATGRRAPRATAGGDTAWAGTAAGARAPVGVAAPGGVSWQGAAVGQAPAVEPATGTAEGSTSWTAAATGERSPAATATGETAWAGNATGTAERYGTSTGATSWTGSATGERSPIGSTTGATTWTGNAAGHAPGGGSGSAAGTTTWTGAATGERTAVATANGTTSWAGVAVGTTTRTATATGATAWSGTATGSAPAEDIPKGTATGTTAWASVATGNRHPKAAAAGAVQWAGTAHGINDRAGTAAGTTAWTGTAHGSNQTGRDIMIRVLAGPTFDRMTILGPHMEAP